MTKQFISPQNIQYVCSTPEFMHDMDKFMHECKIEDETIEVIVVKLKKILPLLTFSTIGLSFDDFELLIHFSETRKCEVSFTIASKAIELLLNVPIKEVDSVSRYIDTVRLCEKFKVYMDAIIIPFRDDLIEKIYNKLKAKKALAL